MYWHHRGCNVVAQRLLQQLQPQPDLLYAVAQAAPGLLLLQRRLLLPPNVRQVRVWLGGRALQGPLLMLLLFLCRPGVRQRQQQASLGRRGCRASWVVRLAILQNMAGRSSQLISSRELG